jgi:hypothetical protein
LQFKHRHGRPPGNLDRASRFVDSDENYWALRGLNGLGPGRVAGGDSDQHVHAAAPRIDQAGVHFDKFTHTDGPVEVKVAHGGGDAVTATPLRGGGMGGLVDPFE